MARNTRNRLSVPREKIESDPDVLPGERLPTPDEIDAVCQSIRAGWTAEELEARAVGHSPRWAVPVGRSG